jgi:hypothetical protein
MDVEGRTGGINGVEIKQHVVDLKIFFPKNPEQVKDGASSNLARFQRNRQDIVEYTMNFHKI